MAINYRTIQDPGKSLRAQDTSMAASQRGFAQGYATMAAIQAQISARREMAKREQQAKDTWRDQQMADVTDTTFVEKMHGSIHESAYSWLKGKQQRYAELTDMLMQEGMNSRNPQWADIQNERKRIEGAYNNFSTNLDAFKVARQTTAEMRGPDITDGEYNEVAKTPNSENALGFLYDREFEGGYGDIEIADDGSFTFPDTEWDGKPIGSGNLPSVTDMPYKEQQTLNNNTMAYGDQIKNKTRDINNQRNLDKIRGEIHSNFKGMSLGKLQAFILNDMDGDGGIPGFLSELAPGENPTLTWTDQHGKEQSMEYNNLMANKDALVSFASTNYYDGTMEYLKGQVPVDSEEKLGTQARADIDKIIGDSIEINKGGGLYAWEGYTSWEEWSEATGKPIPKEAYNVQKSRENAVQNFINSDFVPSSVDIFPLSTLRDRNFAWERFLEKYKSSEEERNKFSSILGEKGIDSGKKKLTNEQMIANAKKIFDKQNGDREVFVEYNDGRLIGFDIDPTDGGAMTNLFVRHKWITQKTLEMRQGLNLDDDSGSVLPLD